MSEKIRVRLLPTTENERVTVKLIRPNGRMVYDYDWSSFLGSESVKRDIKTLELRKDKVAAATSKARP